MERLKKSDRKNNFFLFGVFVLSCKILINVQKYQKEQTLTVINLRVTQKKADMCALTVV